MKKMPLGKLSKKQIQSAYKVLTELQGVRDENWALLFTSALFAAFMRTPVEGWYRYLDLDLYIAGTISAMELGELNADIYILKNT